MIAHLRAALVLFAAMTVITGVIYPLAVTAIAQALFPHQANGSLIEQNGKVVGSELIGQPFDDPKYFWGRPSATGPFAYNAASSSGSNLGPLNPALLEAVKQRIAKLREADPANQQPVPVDLVTASASGLDPEISMAAVQFQVGRVARARNLDVVVVDKLVKHHSMGRVFRMFGEPRVNVLELNRALDNLAR